MKILVASSFVQNEFFKRSCLLTQMHNRGHKVTVAGHELEGENICQTLGIDFALIPLANGKLNPFFDLRTFSQYYCLIKKGQFDAVHTYTAKPNIYSSIAARLAGVKHIYPTVNGLGYVFIDGHGFKKRALRVVISCLYKIAFACAAKVFFQNPDDMAEMVRRRLISEKKCVVVPGSGIDLEAFPYAEPGPENVFLFAARLLFSKGIHTYAAAAEIVKKTHPEARFLVAGAMSSNPDGLTEEDLERCISSGILEYLGEVEDMPAALAGCSVLVLPTYYREGVPHVLLEAMSTGRAILTTDVPGCRETVNGENGFLVEPKKEEALAEKMLWLLEHPGAVREMGQKGREYAEERFDVEKVNALILETMGM